MDWKIVKKQLKEEQIKWMQENEARYLNKEVFKTKREYNDCMWAVYTHIYRIHGNEYEYTAVTEMNRDGSTESYLTIFE